VAQDEKDLLASSFALETPGGGVVALETEKPQSEF
jgi:hypothetical protein